MAVAAVPVGDYPEGIAVTPDGKRVYATGGYVNVIETATNTVVATLPAGGAVGIVPPPPGVPFLVFSAQLAIHFGGAPNQDAFGFHSHFTLSSTDSNGIHPRSEMVKIQIGTFTIKIPPGSFAKLKDGSFIFDGVIHGVNLQARIRPTGTLRYAFAAKAQGADLAGSKNPVQVALTIGDDSGTTSVRATNLEIASE
jgi:hypothetical protein